MRDEDISREDIHQQYINTLFLYDGAPVFGVDLEGKDKDITVFDLTEQQHKVVPFTFKKVAPPPRIGFVNTEGECVYLSRIPSRRMAVGIKSDTLEVKIRDGFIGDARAISKRLSRLRSVEIANAIKNKYPTLYQACQAVRNGDAAAAFDRQFCVTAGFNLVYKTKFVGYVDPPVRGKFDIERLRFNPEFAHLNSLLV